MLKFYPVCKRRIIFMLASNKSKYLHKSFRAAKIFNTRSLTLKIFLRENFKSFFFRNYRRYRSYKTYSFFFTSAISSTSELRSLEKVETIRKSFILKLVGGSASLVFKLNSSRNFHSNDQYSFWKNFKLKFKF